jgi:cytochrome c-type biogenesis protein CcmE
MGINAHGRKGGGTVKAKHQRLILALAALSAVVGSGVLAMSGLKDRASYFYAPGDVARQGIPSGAIRLGGMVTNGSLVKAPDGVTLSFVVHDENNQVPVRFRPICSRKGRALWPRGHLTAKPSSRAISSPSMTRITNPRRWPAKSIKRIRWGLNLSRSLLEATLSSRLPAPPVITFKLKKNSISQISNISPFFDGFRFCVSELTQKSAIQRKISKTLAQ